MVLENLAFLDSSMRAAGCRATRFSVRCGGLTLSVVYLNDTCPPEFLILRHEPRQWLRVVLQKGHDMEPRHLRPLVEPQALPDTPLSPAVRRLVEDFAIALPRTVAEVEKAAPEVVLQHSPDVDEPGKIHFAGWSPLPPEARPQHPKLQKTRRAFGQDVYELCLHLHLGSQWTDDATQRVKFFLPE